MTCLQAAQLPQDPDVPPAQSLEEILMDRACQRNSCGSCRALWAEVAGALLGQGQGLHAGLGALEPLPCGPLQPHPVPDQFCSRSLKPCQKEGGFLEEEVVWGGY